MSRLNLAVIERKFDKYKTTLIKETPKKTKIKIRHLGSKKTRNVKVKSTKLTRQIHIWSACFVNARDNYYQNIINQIYLKQVYNDILYPTIF